MALAFLHGEIIVAWFLAGALALLVGSLLALGLWLYPPKSPLLVSAIYLSLAIVFMARWLNDESNLATSSLGFAFTMPWSALCILAVLSFQIEIPLWVVLPGLVVNAFLIYYAAKWARGRKLRRSQTGATGAPTVQ